MQISKKFSLILIVVAVAAIALSACGNNAALSQAQASTAAAATIQALLPTSTTQVIVVTATSAPVTPAPASTATTAAQVVTTTAAVRFNFATGTTFGAVQGSLQPDTTQSYVLNASKGQPFLVSLDSFNNDMYFSVTGKDGKVLLPASSKLNSWQTELPSSQDYTIQVFAGASQENFTLSVEIPSRINFASGAISDTLSGFTVNGYQVSYVLTARKNQTMSISLNAPGNSAALTVYGYTDGTPYLRSAAGSTTFSQKLPSTQDYIIKVVPNASTVVKYSLTVSIK